MKRALSLACLFLLSVTAHAQNRGTASSNTCDRECLRRFITQYLDAMITHNPKTLPIAATARFTEDTKTLSLGEGLWKGASKIRRYRQDLLDVREGVAASHVVVEENGMPAMLALRLKIADRKITEIETMVTRSKAEGAIAWLFVTSLRRTAVHVAVVAGLLPQGWPVRGKPQVARGD